ncbi:MAG: AAA family ATPase [Candidatus Aenigmatarchaeota archaeon]
MSKKNTLLYLDENLVKEAKRRKINLSKLTESAIKSKIFPDMSEGQKKLFDLEGYLESLEQQGKCFRLSHWIKHVELKNIGPIDHFEVNLAPLTVIKGSNGSGKTFLLRSLAHVCGCIEEDLSNFLKHGKDSGKIEIKTANSPKSLISIEDGKVERKYNKCLLIDDPLDSIEKSQRKAFIKGLREQFVIKGWQVILTDQFFEEDELVDKVMKLKG